MTAFTVTIHDTISWTVTLHAPDREAAERIALEMFDGPERDSRFRWADEITTHVEEAVS